MKKANAQAELLSQPGRPPRASPANCGFLKQKHLAELLKLHVPHDNKLMKKSNAQAEPPSSPGELLRGSPAFYYFFLFFNRLQAQAHSNRRGQPRLSRPFFFIFLIR